MINYIADVRIPTSLLIPENINEDTDFHKIRSELFVRSFFHFNESLNGFVKFSSEEIGELIGLTCNKYKLTSRDRYKNIVSVLKEYITDEKIIPITEQNLDTKLEKHLIFRNNIIEPGYTGKDHILTGGRFVPLTIEEYEAIIQERDKDEGFSNPLIDLHVYLFIKSFIYIRSKRDSEKMRPECCLLAIEQISDGCGISKDRAKESIDFLRNFAQVIASTYPKRIRCVKNNSYSFEIPKTVYVLKKSGYEQELMNGKEKCMREFKNYLKANGKKMCSYSDDYFDEAFA